MVLAYKWYPFICTENLEEIEHGVQVNFHEISALGDAIAKKKEKWKICT